MKNKKVLLIARFSDPNFKVSVELLKSYIVHSWRVMFSSPLNICSGYRLWCAVVPVRQRLRLYLNMCQSSFLMCLLMHWGLRSQLVLFSSQLWVTAIHRRSRISLDMRVSFISMSCSSTWNLTLMLYSSSCHNFQRPHLATPKHGVSRPKTQAPTWLTFGPFWIKMCKNIVYFRHILCPLLTRF